MSTVRAVHVDTLTLAEICKTNTNALQVLKWANGRLLPGEKRQESELQKRKKKSRKEETVGKEMEETVQVEKECGTDVESGVSSTKKYKKKEE